MDKQLCAGTEEYLKQRDDSMMEKYFSLIKEHSFSSRFVPLPREAAVELKEAHRLWRETPASWQWHEHRVDFPALEALRSAMDGERQHLAGGNDGFFVRISTRSPKDAVLSGPGFRSVCNQEYDTLCAIEREYPAYEGADLNRRLHALYRASTFAMKMPSADLAIQLMSESSRIQDDLSSCVERADGPAFNVVLREFVDFSPELEFRAFVYERRLTAITQYNPLVYFPRLPPHQDDVQTAMELFLAEMILPRLPAELASCVVDLLLLSPQGRDSYDELQVKVVEINPLAEYAVTGLYSWTCDKAELLGIGYDRCSFRILSTPPPHQRLKVRTMAPQWRQFVAGEGISS
eukprot:CAMPEP_0119123782 /NCGR_PEP_ID=MMETSP1310-20130426/3611_1 /TAXON_ID=464262 /ORGANISM="Genus nov. species nov., Strain RCC2339" /LENGTH=347 /DNA_ID=CAMNT_0007113645 /DNA_START=139 /DNA_END=1182 /DNA_ORIENTATION=-